MTTDALSMEVRHKHCSSTRVLYTYKSVKVLNDARKFNRIKSSNFKIVDMYLFFRKSKIVLKY